MWVTQLNSEILTFWIRLIKLFLILSFFLPISLNAQERKATEKRMDETWGETSVSDSKINKKAASWYEESKFAMFIHWGLYSVPAGEWKGQHYYGISEWIMRLAKIPTQEYYHTLAPVFNPVNFNAEKIVQLAIDAGMKYIVITSKHCDGFAMYHSKVSNHNIVDATPYKRDPLKELSDACKAKGIGLGLYYAQAQDWSDKNAYGNTWEFNPEEINFQDYFENKVLPQVEELLTNYGPIKLIFFDTPMQISKEAVVQLRDLVRKIQPECLINSRIGHGMGDFITLGDNEIPDETINGLWESIDTHNNSWAFSKLDNNWKTDKEIIHRLIKVVTRGGNYMLNIGPKGDGAIPEESLHFLTKTGEWVKKNSEAIYKTKAVDLGIQTGIGATTSGSGKTFLFVSDWPKDGKLWIPKNLSNVNKASFPDGKDPLEIKNSGADIYLTIPLIPPDPRANVIVLEHKGEIKSLNDQYLWPNMVTEFLPVHAITNSVSKANVSWMEIFGDWHHVSVLENWQNKESYASWSFYTPVSGKYIVEIDYACNLSADLKEGLLCIDSDCYNFVPVFTGDITDLKGIDGRIIPRFSTRRIGVINIKSNGIHTVKIQLNDNADNGWIRLQRLRFTPIIW